MGTRSSATSSFAISCASDASGGLFLLTYPERLVLLPFGGRTRSPTRGTDPVAGPRFQGDQSEARCLGDRFEPRVGAELSQHRLHVRTESRGRYAERLRRGGRAGPAREKPQHLELPSGEGLDDLARARALEQEALQLAGREQDLARRGGANAVDDLGEPAALGHVPHRSR